MKRIRGNAECHPLEPHHAKGLCKVCFNRNRYLENRPENKLVKNVKAACHTERDHYAAGLCYECYSVKRPPNSELRPDRMADCHPSRKHYAKGLCSKCYDAEKHKAKYRHIRDEVLERQKKWFLENKEWVFERELARKFGITLQKYAEILESQNGKCAICKKIQKDIRRLNFCVDHDRNCCSGNRTCGKCVRGLLCITCNAGLGQFYDSTEFLKSAIQYLEQRRITPKLVMA